MKTSARGRTTLASNRKEPPRWPRRRTRSRTRPALSDRTSIARCTTRSCATTCGMRTSPRARSTTSCSATAASPGVATRVATDKDIQDELRSTIAELRKAADRVQGKEEHKGRNGGLLLPRHRARHPVQPDHRPRRRASGSPTACSAAATTSRTRAATAATARRRASRSTDHGLRGGLLCLRHQQPALTLRRLRRERAVERRRVEPARARDVATTAAGSRPPSARCRRAAAGVQPDDGVEAHVLQVLPRRAGSSSGRRRRRSRGRAGRPGCTSKWRWYGVPCASPVSPTKPSTSPALHDRAVDGERRVRREVRVVELVALVVAQPEPPAADACSSRRRRPCRARPRAAASRAARRCRRRDASRPRRRRGPRRTCR